MNKITFYATCIMILPMAILAGISSAHPSSHIRESRELIIQGSSNDAHNAQAEPSRSITVLSDEIVGDGTVTFDNIEFARDMQWGTILEQGSRRNRRIIWLFSVDPDAGIFTPEDGRGLMLDEVDGIDGLAYFGEDIHGTILTYVDLQGNLWEVRPKLPIGKTTVTKLATPADATRSSAYPSTLPDHDGYYVTYRQEDSRRRVQVLYISSKEPETQHMVTKGKTNWYRNPLVVFPRWFKDRPVFIFAYTKNRHMQVMQYDVSQPGSSKNPRVVTTDAVSHLDMYPFSYKGVNYLVGGGSTSMYGILYKENKKGLFKRISTLAPGDVSLDRPGLASSFEPFEWNGTLYSAFGIHDLPPSLDAVRNHAGEIHCVSLFDDPVACRIAGGEGFANSDPEFLVGKSRVWIFYHSRSLGSGSSTMHLRRAEITIK